MGGRSVTPTPAAFARALDAAFVGELGIRDRYLVERGGKTWTAEGESLDESTWLEHVLGKIRLGAIQPADRTLYAAIDLDGKRQGTSDPDPERFAAVRELIPRLVRFARETLLVEPFVELTRSGCGYRVGLLFSEDDAPSQGEARLFLRGLLRAFDLPDDGAEGSGHPGIFPRPPGAESVGGTVFAPLGGICNGARASRFVHPETLEPLADQLAALEGAERYTRDDLHGALDALVTRLEERGIRPPTEEAVTVYAQAAESPADAVDRPEFLAEVVELAERLGSISSGRNPAAFAAAARLGNRIAAGQGTVETAEPALLEAMHRNGFATDPRPGYGERAALKTIHRGFRKGMTTPRPYPEAGPACAVDVTEAASDLDEPEWIRDDYDADHGPMTAAVSVVEDATEEPTSSVETATEPADSYDDECPVAFPASCWRGPVEAYRSAWSETTEAPDEYLWPAYMLAAGLMVGRSAYKGHELGHRTYPNLYAVLVGPSGKSRKTTAYSTCRRIVHRCDESVVFCDGVSSGAALVEFLAPSEAETGPDGRLTMIRRAARTRGLLSAGEVSSLLLKGRQDGSRDVIPRLVEAYDCPETLENRTRSKPVRAEEPFLSFFGGTTPEWFRRDLAIDDVRGGLAGRICYFLGKRKPAIPDQPPPNAVALRVAERALLTIRDAHATDRAYEFTPAARSLWEDWYRAEYGRAYENPILGAVAARLHTNATKIALLFAVLDGAASIDAEHVAAATDFANYQRDVQRAIFTAFGESDRAALERRVVETIRRRGPLPTWGLRQWIRNVPADDLKKSIAGLSGVGEIVELRTRSGRGKAWHLAAATERVSR